MNPSDTTGEAAEHPRAVISIRNAEIVVAIALAVASAIVIWSNYQLGAGWSSYGPEAGYFPLRLGVVILIASGVVLVQAIRTDNRAPFLEVAQAKLVAVILLPLITFVFAVGYLGIYVASVLFVAAFMIFLGKFVWWKAAAVSLGLMLAFFFVFEIQFKVPLPKGPLERMLGF